jgi:hypothetical protein
MSVVEISAMAVVVTNSFDIFIMDISAYVENN